MSAELHPGELSLRRLRADELAADEASQFRAHLDGCSHCRARLRAFDEEQRRFEANIPFDRFSTGVARAIRRPHRAEPPRARWLYPAMGVAAAIALMVATPGLLSLVEPSQRHAQLNRVKGGADMTLRIAGQSGHPQRTAAADAPEPLGAGERVRIGYKSGGYPWVLAISIDAEGEISPLYPEEGRSLPTEPDPAELHFFPGSLEFTGRGAERVIVVLSDEPLAVDAVSAAAKRAYGAAGGDVAKIAALELPGAQFHRTVLKPQEGP
ncbi:MAG: zf-HC2 domain-containing protein [Myxococcaceae bacterium]